ncbi:hypothetical protein AbraIFM66950_010570 [Aspergillus brasiliensis]|nr:hypothetical protein AbraIFM66950_010570 [Aspergillus brasiliensis]
MTSQEPIWSTQDLLFGQHDKWAQITLACKGNRFRIEISPENFIQSPSSFEKYSRFIDLMYDDYAAETAEDNFYDWALAPFLPIFDRVEPSPSTGQPATLRDYLSPRTYYYQLYFVNERPEPRYDYEVRRTLRVPGVDIGDFALSPNWGKYTPDQVQQCLNEGEYPYSRRPRKVCVDGKLCFLKEAHTKRGLLRELDAYKSMESRGLSDNPDVCVPRLVGVVYGLHGSCQIIGILLSLVDCENLTLSCALLDEVTFYQRKRWEEQIATTVELLHEAGIVWGDVKTDNVLIDKNDDAWMIDFGGGYTEGWVEKKHMETMKGDEEGLFKILERLYADPSSGHGGDEAHEEMAAMREG